METEQEAAIDSERKIQEIRDALSPDRFREWYGERQYRENIENGTPYFNGPASIPEAERHSPSRLLKCHRKVFYQQCNAPEETSDPDGIFWFGTRFEEDIAFPFLERAVTDSETYVQNSVWVDFRVEIEGVELHIKGETDPLIVDVDAVPVLPTEIKTKSSVEHTTEPNRSHLAQIHAYMAGLSEKYDIDLTDGVVIYGSRETMDVKIFHIEFDSEFWEDIVLEWAAEHTHYRLSADLPPAEPENDWECEFCAYRERCGQGSRHYSNCGPTGLLTRYSGYPYEKLVNYLDSHADARLTPSLAFEHEDLADEYGVYDWECTRCDKTYTWDSAEWDGDVTHPPRCPTCFETDSIGLLRGPEPDDQLRSGDYNVSK